MVDFSTSSPALVDSGSKALTSSAPHHPPALLVVLLLVMMLLMLVLLLSSHLLRAVLPTPSANVPADPNSKSLPSPNPLLPWSERQRPLAAACICSSSASNE